ncbi:MAG: M48 family metalloprotease [Terriglobia bacterium]
MNSKPLLATALPCLLALAITLSATAGQQPDKTANPALVTLYLNVVSPFEVDGEFDLYPSPSVLYPATIRQELEDSLGCKELKEVDIDEDDPWSLAFKCLGALPRRGLMAEGKVNIAPVLPEARSRGAEAVYLTIAYSGQSPFRCSGPAGYELESRSSKVHRFRIPANAVAPSVIALSVGYLPPELARLVLPLLVLLSLPIVLTLWVRSKVLSSPDAARAGAWFGYRRFLQWNMLGGFLLWVAAIEALRVEPLLKFVLSTGAAGQSTVLETFLFYAVFLVPPSLASVASTVLSHPVFVELQGATWSRSEISQQAIWSQMATMLPLAMLAAGLVIVFGSSPAWGALSILAALLVRNLSAQRLMKIADREPHALTSGELRDHAFALAQKAGVKLNQIYLLPTRKARTANACARQGNDIILTDYLLEHLSKREVDAVVGHELAHLRKRHPAFLLLVFLTAMGVAGALAGYFDSVFPWLPEGLFLPVAIVVGVCLFYLVSRRFERRADAAAVRLTGDPEAMIRALAKLTWLNRMPLHWGRLQNATISHPSILRRVREIARQAAIPEGRLNQILGSPEESPDRYSIPASAAPQGKVFSTAFKSRMAGRLGWCQIAASTVVPAFAALIGAHLHSSVPRWGVLATGLLVTAGLSLYISNIGPTWGDRALKQQVLERTNRSGLAANFHDAVFVGLSPHSLLRLYETNYDWDVGFVILAGDRFCYCGEETSFALGRDQITSISLGPGFVSWWPTRRVYVNWRDEAGANGTFNLRPVDSATARKSVAAASALARRLEGWRESPPLSAGLSAELAGLPNPTIGEVTSLSPRQLGSLRSYLSNSAVTAILACVVGVLFGLLETPHAWGILYTVAAALLVGVGRLLPYSLYRERPA